MNIEQLPATQIDPSQMTAEPLSEINVGDLVAVHSRGSYRLAQVTKVGPKRVEVIYTTQGAWNDAIKIHTNYTSPGFTKLTLRDLATEGKNYDFRVREMNPETAVYNKVDQYTTQEQVDKKTAMYAAEIAGRTKEQYLADLLAAAIADRTARRDEAVAGGPTQYVHVTTKSCKREDVFGLVS